MMRNCTWAAPRCLGIAKWNEAACVAVCGGTRKELCEGPLLSALVLARWPSVLYFRAPFDRRLMAGAA